MRPNLVVIGAAKCGTTSLHEYLNAHPQIAMSREKELDFFVAEKNWSRGLDWYEAQFEDAPIRGESSVSYAAFPEYQGVPERIVRALPDARVIYLVRDPVERVVCTSSTTRSAIPVNRSTCWPRLTWAGG